MLVCKKTFERKSIMQFVMCATAKKLNDSIGGRFKSAYKTI